MYTIVSKVVCSVLFYLPPIPFDVVYFYTYIVLHSCLAGSSLTSSIYECACACMCIWVYVFLREPRSMLHTGGANVNSLTRNVMWFDD